MLCVVCSGGKATRSLLARGFLTFTPWKGLKVDSIEWAPPCAPKNGSLTHRDILTNQSLTAT